MLLAEHTDGLFTQPGSDNWEKARDRFEMLRPLRHCEEAYVLHGTTGVGAPFPSYEDEVRMSLMNLVHAMGSLARQQLAPLSMVWVGGDLKNHPVPVQAWLSPTRSGCHPPGQVYQW